MGDPADGDMVVSPIVRLAVSINYNWLGINMCRSFEVTGYWRMHYRNKSNNYCSYLSVRPKYAETVFDILDYGTSVHVKMSSLTFHSFVSASVDAIQKQQPTDEHIGSSSPSEFYYRLSPGV